MYRVVRTATVAMVALLLCEAPLSVSAEDATVKTGILTCQVASGFGYIIGSSRTMECRYIPFSGTPERYMGTISKVGVDIGYLAPVVIAWAVVAPSAVPGSGALAGNYFGASAQAAVGIGGGVNVLTGGFEKSISLQPVSVEGDTGLYVGAGISSMSLQLENR